MGGRGKTDLALRMDPSGVGQILLARQRAKRIIRAVRAASGT